MDGTRVSFQNLQLDHTAARLLGKGRPCIENGTGSERTEVI